MKSNSVEENVDIHYFTCYQRAFGSAVEPVNRLSPPTASILFLFVVFEEVQDLLLFIDLFRVRKSVTSERAKAILPNSNNNNRRGARL